MGASQLTSIMIRDAFLHLIIVATYLNTSDQSSVIY